MPDDDRLEELNRKADLVLAELRRQGERITSLEVVAALYIGRSWRTRLALIFGIGAWQTVQWQFWGVIVVLATTR